MFDPTTEQLHLEIMAAIEETAQHTDPAQDILRRTTGRWYRKDQAGQEPDPENFGYAFLSNVLPQLVGDNPKTKAKAARVIGHKTITDAMDDGVNTLVQELDWVERHLPVAADFLMVRGVTIHFLEEDARFSRGTVTPALKRVPVTRFFQDSLAEDPGEDEFRGHWFYVDVEDLKNDPRAKKEAVNILSPDGDESVGDGRLAKEAYHDKKRRRGDLERRRVRCYAVWMRKKNTIRVLAEGSQVVELYEEVEYWGDPSGPYELYDAYPVPGQAWPLSPMIAVEDQARDLNIHARAMGRAAARRKTVGLVEASNPDVGDKLADAEDGELMAVKGITGNYVQIEVGGVTTQQYQVTEFLRNRLDRVSGMTATVQGDVGAAKTATEATIADNALANRIRYLKDRYTRAAERSLKKLAWMLFHTPGIIIPVNRRDPYSGQEMEGLFLGGPFPTDMGARWEDFRLKIVKYSMQRESQQMMQGRVFGFYEFFERVMGMVPVMPYVRWMSVLRDVGDAFDMGDKAEEWVIPEFFGAFSQPQQAPVSQYMGSPGPPAVNSYPFRTNVGQPNRAGGGQQQEQRGVNFGNPSMRGNVNGQAVGPRPQQQGNVRMAG